MTDEVSEGSIASTLVLSPELSSTAMSNQYRYATEHKIEWVKWYYGGHSVRQVADMFAQRYPDIPNANSATILKLIRKFEKTGSVENRKPSGRPKLKVAKKCDWPGCDFVALKKNSMKSHYFVHCDKFAQKCDWPGCEKVFRDRSHLNVHMAQHTGIKQYKCVWPNCNKSFATSYRLRNHIAIHEGDKRHKCLWQSCDKTFVDRGNMRKHYRIHLKNG